MPEIVRIIPPKVPVDRKKDRHKPKEKPKSRKAAASVLALAGVTTVGSDGRSHPRVLVAVSGDNVHEYSCTDGVDSIAILDWILSVRELYTDKVIFVCYGLDAEVNQWLATLGRSDLAVLDGRELVFVDATRVGVTEDGRADMVTCRYRIEWIRGRALTVSRQRRRMGPLGRLEWVPSGSVRVWGVSGFFQQSLADTLRDWGEGDISYHEVAAADLLRARPDLTDSALSHARSVALASAREVARIMASLRVRLRTEYGLTLTQYHGVGALASALLAAHGMDIETARGHVPSDAEDAIARAYYGGRVEDHAVGLFKQLYAYDLNAAYPAAMAMLPTLAGRWRRADSYAPGLWAVWRVRWHISTGDRLAPFPFRYRDRILYCERGEGWYWGPEVDAAREIYGERVEVLDGWWLEPAHERRPFGWLEDLYERRHELAQDRDPMARVLKLGMAAISGKLVQGRGWAGREPRYRSLVWAGLHTSLVRSWLLRAAHGAGESLVAFATDCIYATEPIPGMAIGEGLGQWRQTVLSDVMWVANGIHAEGVSEAVARGRRKTRGYVDGEVDFADVLAVWRSHGLAGEVTVPARRLVGLKAALHGVGWDTWRTWHDTTARLSLWPNGGKVPAALMSHSRRTAHPDVAYLLPGPLPDDATLADAYSAGESAEAASQSVEWLLAQEQPL